MNRGSEFIWWKICLFLIGGKNIVNNILAGTDNMISQQDRIIWLVFIYGTDDFENTLFDI